MGEPALLHNGSVPNLYELLLPAAQRSKQFFVGRDFDPVRVGVDTSGETGRFLFDSSRPGNSNAGHSFKNGTGRGIIGPLLSDDARWAIVEYLKSIPDTAAQATPYGGPANPVRAWLDPGFTMCAIRGRITVRPKTGARGNSMSDHVDGPRTTADPAIDLTDLYAFVSPENPKRMVLIANVFPGAGGTPPCFRMS